MNREKKYRVWDREEKIISEGLPFEWFLTGEPGDMEFPSTGESLPLKDFIFFRDHFEMMDFTGLQDKNKKDVYDGDICRTDVNIKLWVVRWGNYEWEFINHQIKEAKHRMAGDEQYSFSEYLPMLKRASAGIEVIGNIYENPELLTPVKP